MFGDILNLFDALELHVQLDEIIGLHSLYTNAQRFDPLRVNTVHAMFVQFLVWISDRKQNFVALCIFILFQQLADKLLLHNPFALYLNSDLF